ncbi:MAG: hypothetical protein LBS36_09630 [Oscillospiraceae bacterium]|jgi:hypothetical protein|nr:hypothetical protein [Oscillospiraceae bacterium]
MDEQAVVSLIYRPQRKCILKRARAATGYFEHGSEVGFEHWNVLKSIEPSLFGEPVGMWFAENLRPAHTSEYVMGIEVPLHYNAPPPVGMDTVVLDACLYLLFHGRPFPPEELKRATDALKTEAKSYNPAARNLKWAPDKAPVIEYDPLCERGCMIAYPVESLHD